MGIREIRSRIIELIEKWEPRFSLVAILILGLAWYLAQIGSERGEITREAAELIDRGCFASAALVGLLQLSNWIWILLQPPPDYRDPSGEVPQPDMADKEGLVFPSAAGFGFPKFRFFIPDEDALEWFVEWSEHDPAIAEANELARHQRALLYESWYGVDPRYFLVMQRKATVGAGWETVAISIILALPEKTLAKIRAGKMAVIDVRSEHLAFGTRERAGRYLLYDTLIFRPDFRELHSEFKRWHSLVHLAQFDAPASGAEVTVLIEPDNPRLRVNLGMRSRYGPHRAFKIVGGHIVYEFTLPRRGPSPRRIRRFEEHWRALRTVPWKVPVGSV